MIELKQRVIDYITEIDVLKGELKIYQDENSRISSQKKQAEPISNELVKKHMYNTRVMVILLTSINSKIQKLNELYTIMQLSMDIEETFSKEEIEVLDIYLKQQKSPILISNGKIIEAVPNLFSIIKEKVEELPQEEIENYKSII